MEIRYQEIKAIILNEIQGMMPDTRLDSRPDLCKRLETTRTTLDRAIAELVGEGFLYSQNGSGTYVNHPKRRETTLNTERWGVIVPSVTENIYSEILSGVEVVASGQNINVLLSNSDGDMDRQKRCIQRMKDCVTGMIIVPAICKTAHEGYQLFKQLEDAKIPFVFCNRGLEGVEAPVVTSNDFYGGYIATRHLIEKGYKKIAYLSKIRYETSLQRCHGYITALMEAGIEIDRKLIVLQEKGRKNLPGYDSMKRFFALDRGLDAVFCFNDLLIPGVLQAAQEQNMRIPQDMGIIGYDNSPICEAQRPKITSVSYQSRQIGAKAAEILMKLISGQYHSDFDLYLFQPEIVERESTIERSYV